MALIEEFDKQGSFLFRWRSYIPSLILATSFIFIPESKFLSGNYDYQLIYLLACFAVSLFGLFIRAFTIGYTPRNTSGRNTKKQVADTVNQTGIYSLIRHPLYVGNFFMFFGVVLIIKSISFAFIFVLFYWFYYERIMFTEEQFLRAKFGSKYLTWAERTPALIPNGFGNYKSPPLDFSLKNVLKREYPSLFGIVLIFLIYDILIIYFNQKGQGFDFMALVKPWHTLVFSANAIFYIAIRVLVKFTKLLEVEGR